MNSYSVLPKRHVNHITKFGVGFGKNGRIAKI